MRVYGLARVSSQVQATDGTSLEAQQEQLAAYCRAHGLAPPDVDAGTLAVEVESGGAAAQERRTEVERVVRAAASGDLVLVTKVDRWSRDLPWGVATARALVKRGVGWRSIGEGIDATTANGDFVLGIMMAVADAERQRIRERTVGARQRLRAQGFHVEGQPPLGYLVVDRRLVIDANVAPCIRMMFALCIAGRSTRSIADELLITFPALPIDGSAIARRLRDRRYLGESCSKGSKGRKPRTGTWRTTHDALVDADTWHRAQTSLSKRSNGGRGYVATSRTAAFMLRGLIVCAHCGSAMGANSPEADASVKHGGYYVCRRRSERKRTGSVERCDGPIVRHREVDEHVARLALARLEALAGILAQPAEKRPPRPDGAAERARLLRRRERVVTAIADGTITAVAARSTVATIEAGIAALDARPLPAPAIDRHAVLGQVEALRRTWATMTPEARGKALRLLTDRIVARSTATKRWQRRAWAIEVTWHEWD